MTNTTNATYITDLMAYAAQFNDMGLPTAHYERARRLCRILGVNWEDVLEAAAN